MDYEHDMTPPQPHRNPCEVSAALLDKITDNDIGGFPSIDDALLYTLAPVIGDVETAFLADQDAGREVKT